MPQDGVLPHSPRGARLLRQPAVPSAILGTLIFVATEAMFFAGLLSAFVIVKAGIKPGMWPPPWQPRLPVEATAFNTVVLLLSGVALLAAGTSRLRRTETAHRALVVLALCLGAFFVVFQGYEWARLLAEGLTLQSSNHGAFFYLLVGTHALHALAAVVVLGWAARRLFGRVLTRPQFVAVQIFWTFVVGLWPIVYALVYL